MKFFDKLGLVLFSLMVLILSIITCALILNWIEFDLLSDMVKDWTQIKLVSNIILGVSIFCMILSLKCIFFNSFSKEEMKNKDGILMENENGKLLVTKDTIESLTNTVIKSFENAESATTKVELTQENQIKIFITLFVKPEAVIKELSNKLQIKVKEAIKNSIDLDVLEVDIRVKNISMKKEKIVEKEVIIKEKE